MKFHIYGQPSFVRLPKSATVRDLRALSHFNRVIRNYLKMDRIAQSAKTNESHVERTHG